MNRTHMILGGLLAVQVVLLLVLNLGALGGAEASAAPHALLPVLESITPARLAIDDGDETLVLERRDEGWVLPDVDGYPAQGDKVTDLVADLEGIEVRRPIVTSDKYHAALKVDDDEFESRVTIWQEAADEPSVDLIVGTAPNYRITHVRSADADAVYEAVGFSSADIRADAGAWIEKKLVDVPFDELTAVTVENASGRFSLEKKDGVWSVVEPDAKAGLELDQTTVDSFVRGLTSIWLVDPVGRVDEEAQGLAEPAVRVALTRTIPAAPAPAFEEPDAGEVDPAAGLETGDADAVADAAAAAEAPEGDGPSAASAPETEPETEPEVVVTSYRIGGVKDEESGQRYITRDGFDYTVTVSKYDAEKALAKTLDDLVKKADESDGATAGGDS